MRHQCGQRPRKLRNEYDHHPAAYDLWLRMEAQDGLPQTFKADSEKVEIWPEALPARSQALHRVSMLFALR